MNESASKGLTEQAKQRRREYYKEWRRKNPGKNAQYQRRYWEKMAQQGANKKTSDEVKTAKSSD